MNFELCFKGTPAQFAAMAEEYSGRAYQLGMWVTYQGDVHTLTASSDLLDVIFRPCDGSVSKPGWVTAQSAPGGKSLLHVWARDDDWTVLKPVWERLRAEMLRQGWIDDGARAKGTHGSTLDRVREARGLVETGEGKTKACQRAGIDTRTYDRHVDGVIDFDRE